MSVLTRYQMRMAWPDRDEELIARLKIACWREAYADLLPGSILDGLDLRRSTREWAHALRAGIAWIAEQSGAPVGFGHARGDEVTTLYVRQADHGHGVGSELLRHCFDEIACLGHDEAHLWVLEENIRTRRFYDRMGGEPMARRSVGFLHYPGVMEVNYRFRLAA